MEVEQIVPNEPHSTSCCKHKEAEQVGPRVHAVGPHGEPVCSLLTAQTKSAAEIEYFSSLRAEL